MSYKRLVIVPAKLVVEAMKEGKHFYEVNGVRVSIRSNRILTYTKGLKCVTCARVGKYFAAEKRTNDSSWHFNLYHQNKNGSEVMMTSDHILAKANGGGGSLDNRQPMCIFCNRIKSDYSSLEEAKQVGKVSAQLNWYKKLERARSNIAYIKLKISENDTSKNWNGVLDKNLKEYERMKGLIDELEKTKSANGSNVSGKPAESLYSTDARGSKENCHGSRNSSNDWWGFIKKTYASYCRSCFSWR